MTLFETIIAAERYLPDIFTNLLTEKGCRAIGKTRSNFLKSKFVEKYKLDLQSSRKCKNSKNSNDCLKQFKTINDIFSRKIDPALTMPKATGQYDIVSPAESYVRKVSATDEFLIKEAKYNLSTLLSTDTVPSKSDIFIFRLAPEQYHRIHSPTNSTIVSIVERQGTYKSVNPILLNKIPVLQGNYRKIVTFSNGIKMVIVGATCVGSIVLTVKKGDHVKHGDDMGTFKFGGSCVVIVVPYTIKRYNKKITENEKIIQVGDWVCKFAPSKIEYKTRKNKNKNKN
jgi:phosphatidylserine decarboxylase